MHINPLVPELSVQCTVQKTRDLNGHPLVCMFLADDFRQHLIFLESQCTFTKAIFQRQRVNVYITGTT
jgi:hypothetical protein